jgi:hypothetical protein
VLLLCCGPISRRALKSSRWLLLRNRMHLSLEQSVRLQKLLRADEPLLCLYLLRDKLKRLCLYRRPACAMRAREQAEQSAISVLQIFARRLQGYWTASAPAVDTRSTPVWSRASTTRSSPRHRVSSMVRFSCFSFVIGSRPQRKGRTQEQPKRALIQHFVQLREQPETQ